MLGELERLVDERLVQHGLPHAAAAIGGEHEHRFRVVDARGEARRREAAEHHGVDRAEARAGEHGERGLGDHRHVDDHALAALHAERLHHRRHAVHFGVQLAVGEAARLIDLGGDPHERRLLGPRREVTVDGVVAEIELAADEPARKRRPRVIEHLPEGTVPLDQCRLAAPEALAVLERRSVKVAVGRHGPSLTSAACRGSSWRCGAGA